MARWEILTEEQAQPVWDQALARFEDFSPLQSYAWGEYRRGLGWQPCRWMAFDEQNACIAMMQGYLRRYPLGIGIVWSEGGPVGDLAACDSTFHAAVKQTTGLRAVYYRFRCDRQRHIEDALRLTSQGWNMPWSPLTTNYTMMIDLSVTEDALLAGCEHNWRRNLRRSTECNLSVRRWQNPTTEEIVEAYRSMESLKRLEEQHSAHEIDQLLRHLKQNLILYRCDDEHGRLLSVMGCLVSGDKACHVISATNARGRELHASYAIFWALIRHCRNAGVRQFDLAGIDPVRNPGVYRFKRAAGGRPVELLGEWDWASRPWLRWFGNWGIAKRNRIRPAETILKRSQKDAEGPQIPKSDSPRETAQGSNLAAESLIVYDVRKPMVFRSAKVIFVIDCTITLCTIVTSLLGARALGPAGRGDLLVIASWPLVIAMLGGLGLPNAHRYWMAKEPERCSRLFSNAIIFTVTVGVISIVLADLIVPHLVGQRSSEVMTLVRIYQVNIPAALFLSLMRGLLEGTKRFGWAGVATLLSFIVQGVGFAGLWWLGNLTVSTATYTLIIAQTASALLATFAVWRQLRPRWQPSWIEFKNSMHYGLRDYPGCIADFTTLRLDQLMLGGIASSAAIGFYVVAVRLSEVTTYASGALARALLPEVAASRGGEQAESLLSRTLRLTLYTNVLVLIPLWLTAPWILKVLFGASFVPATGAFRWLLAAAVVWSASSIVISGLQGFGYPGLSTIARFLSAAVTAPALIILIPRFGIEGAAMASLMGYSVMLVVGLVALVRRRRLGFWRYLRPQRQDIPIARLRALATLRWAAVRGIES